ncbi:hypothetical protein BDR26DRAFT_868864 [Obelidium mucronatum]|nr:hypothetical protein BDR26DRAFT_868864 [Obelidium mucronatum]
MHQHASLESDPDNGHLAKEAARKQWLKELDEQRRQSQLAKKKDSSERKEPVLVYSSLFEPKRSPACPAAPRLEAPAPTSFFTGGTQNSLVTTHANSNNSNSNKDASFGRRRSQFRDAESSDALRRNDEWRRALQAQIDAKKRRDAEERSQLNQFSQQHPHSFESITGCPRRRSALADGGGGGGGGVYDSFAGFGAQTPAKAAAAPAAEYAELKSPLPTAASKIPRPNLPPRTQKPPPSPLPVIESQQEIHESSPRDFQHDFSPDHQKHQNSHQQRRRSPSPPQNSPPANQHIQNFPLSPTKKLSKILGSVKGGHGYPLSENEQGVLQGGTKKKGAVIVKPNAKPRVKSAFGRTLPPPSNPPEQQQQKKTSNHLNGLNHNKKLPAIIRGGGIVDAGPYPKHAKQQSISKSSSRIVEVEPVAVIPGSKTT